MRYLRKQVINNRSPSDNSLAVTISNEVVMGTTASVLIPKGSTNQRPVDPTLGMMRYNTTTSEVEVYQGLYEGNGVWRSIRYKESTSIIQQSLGLGNNTQLLFGPLTPAPPVITETNSIWTGSNILVIVENVIQIFGNNYTISVDPVGYDPGSYVQFSSAVPSEIEVIVLHGFDR